MVTKRQKIAAIVVTVIVVIAGIVTFLLSQPAVSSPADRVLIHDGDVGPRWNELQRYVLWSGFENVTSSEYVVMSQNSSYIYAYLIVFSSVDDCQKGFISDLQNAESNFHGPYEVIENLSFGDRGFLVRQGVFLTKTQTWVNLEFAKGNVISGIDAQINGPNQPSQAEFINFTKTVGAIQLQKIDSYLTG